MSWLDGQQELQKKIVARERELNMKPVLPAFAGHVPQELKRIYPDAARSFAARQLFYLLSPDFGTPVG